MGAARGRATGDNGMRGEGRQIDCERARLSNFHYGKPFYNVVAPKLGLPRLDQSCHIWEVKQGQQWLVTGWETSTVVKDCSVEAANDKPPLNVSFLENFTGLSYVSYGLMTPLLHQCWCSHRNSLQMEWTLAGLQMIQKHPCAEWTGHKASSHEIQCISACLKSWKELKYIFPIYAWFNPSGAP